MINKVNEIKDLKKVLEQKRESHAKILKELEDKKKGLKELERKVITKVLEELNLGHLKVGFSAYSGRMYSLQDVAFNYSLEIDICFGEVNTRLYLTGQTGGYTSGRGFSFNHSASSRNYLADLEDNLKAYEDLLVIIRCLKDIDEGITSNEELREYFLNKGVLEQTANELSSNIKNLIVDIDFKTAEFYFDNKETVHNVNGFRVENKRLRVISAITLTLHRINNNLKEFVFKDEEGAIITMTAEQARILSEKLGGIKK